MYRGANGRAVIQWNQSAARRRRSNYNRIQVYIDNTVARNMDAYVPFRTGILKKSVILGSRMGSGELVYITPYAHKQYYRAGRIRRKRGPKWFHRMWAARKDHIIREVKNYARSVMR